MAPPYGLFDTNHFRFYGSNQLHSQVPSLGKERLSSTRQVPGVPGVCAKASLPSGGQHLEVHLMDPTSAELSPGTVLRTLHS